MIRNHHDACIARFLTSSFYTCMSYQFQTTINIFLLLLLVSYTHKRIGRAIWVQVIIWTYLTFVKEKKKRKNLTAMDTFTKAATYTHPEPIYKLIDKILPILTSGPNSGTMKWLDGSTK